MPSDCSCHVTQSTHQHKSSSHHRESGCCVASARSNWGLFTAVVGSPETWALHGGSAHVFVEAQRPRRPTFFWWCLHSERAPLFGRRCGPQRCLDLSMVALTDPGCVAHPPRHNKNGTKKGRRERTEPWTTSPMTRQGRKAGTRGNQSVSRRRASGELLGVRAASSGGTALVLGASAQGFPTDHPKRGCLWQLTSAVRHIVARAHGCPLHDEVRGGWRQSRSGPLREGVPPLR